MTLPELFDQVAERGLFVNNLFELERGKWQANLRGPGTKPGEADIYEMGVGPTPQQALARALRKPVWDRKR